MFAPKNRILKKLISAAVAGLLLVSLIAAGLPAYAQVNSSLYISASNLALGSDLTVSAYVSQSVLDKGSFSSPYVQFTLNGKTTEVTSYRVSGEYLIFSFKNLAPQYMNDVITAVPFASKNGSVVEGKSVNVGAAKYCYSQLSKSSDDKLKTLLVDLLNYGSAAQVYVGYKTDSLANADLTSAQAALGTQDSPALSSQLNTAYSVITSPSARWSSAQLVLNNAIVIRVAFSANNADGLYLEVTDKNGAVVSTINEFTLMSGKYTALFDHLNAAQLCDPYYFTIYDKNNRAVSNTLSYSVQTYAYNTRSNHDKGTASDELYALTESVMKYGNAAYAYVHGNGAEDLNNGYKVTFNAAEHATVSVFKTQDVSDGEVTNVAYSRDSESGKLLKDGNGQVNFLVTCDPGFAVDTVTVSGTYKNLKDIGSGYYRITKIESELTVTVTVKERESAGGNFESSYDGKNYKLYVDAVTGSFSGEIVDGVLNITVDEESELALSGTYAGGVRFVADENVNLDIDLVNCTLISDGACPLYIESGNNVDISAKSGTKNCVYDYREAGADPAASVYSLTDLKLKGSGDLTVASAHNNGIHCKDDLEVQKLTLTVNCADNALKGNDSVSVYSGDILLISRAGDGIKTVNSDVSNKGVQRGNITVSGGAIGIYPACDGIDAACDVNISGDPVIDIYTDKFSEYSEEVTAVSDGIYYIRSTSTSYKYSIYFYNSDTDYVWVNSSSYMTVNNGRTTYYYYEMQKPSGYSEMIVYVYNSNQSQGQGDSYYKTSGDRAVNDDYDTIAFTAGAFASFSWTNYTTQPGPGGPGGMQDGNPDKSDISTKGIKAANSITISSGKITVESYDDSIHANFDTELENGEDALGDITISGGDITLSSCDDGIHADGTLTFADGSVNVISSYEGAEGRYVHILGGKMSIVSKDDGINASTTSGEGIVLSGGEIYVYAGGDGIDSNSRTQNDGILFSGGRAVIISTGQSDSSIDTENGYKYTGGTVVGIGRSGGMSSEATKCQNFSSVGNSKTVTFSQTNYYLVVSDVVTVDPPQKISALVVTLGAKSASVNTVSGTDAVFDENGVGWH